MTGLRLERDTSQDKTISDGTRLDGRGFEEFRSVFLKRSVISQATGSAYVEFNDTKVMVGVYGPRKSDGKSPGAEEGQLRCDVKLATFATRQRGTFGQSALEKEYSSLVTSALSGCVLLDRFPMCVVDVYCLVLQAGGSELGAVITAAALALADGGIDMYDMVPACCVSRVEGSLLLDPTTQETEQEDGHVLFAFMPSRNQVAQFNCTGQWQTDAMQGAVELAMGACMQLDAAMRECLQQQPQRQQ